MTDEDFDLGSRSGFHASLQCVAFPPGAKAHSVLPPPPDARLMRFSTYAARGYDNGAPPVPILDSSASQTACAAGLLS